MKADSASDFAAIVRARRKDLGLSQAALAERIGASRKWLSEFEQGKSTAELGLVVRALIVLGMEIDITGPAVRRRDPGRIDLDDVIAAHRRDD